MSEVTTIQLYGTGDDVNAASIDMPDDGLILGAHIMGAVDNASGDADEVRYELNFGATSSATTNDARSVIAVATWKGSLSGTAASYAKSTAESMTDLRPGIKVFGGERVYLHVVVVAGGLNASCRALLICQFQKFAARRR